jgi:hypothetical protein
MALEGESGQHDELIIIRRGPTIERLEKGHIGVDGMICRHEIINHDEGNDEIVK